MTEKAVALTALRNTVNDFVSEVPMLTGDGRDNRRRQRRSDLKPKLVELSSLKMEDGAKELLNSPKMKPYGKYIEAVVTNTDLTPHVEAIANLPLEDRYVWRIASALKWGFADLEDYSVAVDRKTLSPDDLAKLMELVKHRPIQFCIFLKELVGAEQMERMMREGIAVAKQM
jgi:hypothetical protein